MDDEAFIRAIVDSPGDETPRLVYADWLEERGDPRGAYLRAEQEAVRTGNTSEMQELAGGLDPVWVARVTFPPLGVCCEHIRIRERGPVIDAQDIERFEQRSKIRLPGDYRAFLLNYNGGIVNENRYETPDGEVLEWTEHEFYSLKGQPGDADESRLEWWLAFRDQYIARSLAYTPNPRVESWFSQFLQVGRSPDAIFGLLLGVAGPEFGNVRYFDYSAGFHHAFFDSLAEPYAASFATFLTALPSTGYP